MRKILFIFAVSLLFGAVLTQSAQAAEFSVRSEVQRLSVGDEVTLDILLDTEGEQINAFEGNVTLPDKLKIESLRDGSSLASLWVDAPRIATRHNVTFSGIIPGGYTGNNAVLFSLIARAVQEGTGTVAWGGLRTLLNDGKGSTTPASGTSLAYTVLGTSTMPAPSAPSDSVPPEPFSVVLTRDPNIFDGKWFAVFVAQDKGSGIDRYEVAELPGRQLASSNALPWQVASSPYLLLDQSHQSTVYVRAIDRVGNVRVAVAPAVLTAWYQSAWVWSIVGIGLLAMFVGLGGVILVRGYAYKRRRQ